MNMLRLQTIVKSSITHFLVMGGLLFWLAPSPQNQTKILLSRQHLSMIGQVHARKLGVQTLSSRQQAEVKTRLIQDELLYKEGLRLGLDKGDTIIKQRVIQKVSFLAQQLGGASSQVDESTLRAYFKSTRQRWKSPKQLHFVHVYLRQSSAQKWQSIQRQLVFAKGTPKLGDSFLLGNEQPLTSTSKLKSLFGKDFVSSCLKLPLHRWSRPISSKYGTHIVKVLMRKPERVMSFREAREQILFEYLLTRKRNLRISYLKKLQKRYSTEWIP